jgi:hypothetical protein
VALLADAAADKDAGKVAAAVDTAETVPLQLQLQPRTFTFKVTPKK